jgi:hypothetical protein
MSTNNFTHYDGDVNNKTHYSEYVTNISPKETPFQNSVESVTIDNKRATWQADELAPADADNAQIDGADAAEAVQEAVLPGSNFTQIMTETVKVSGGTKSSNPAGYASEMARQTYKKNAELKNSREKMLLQGGAKVEGSNTVAAKSAGILTYIHSNVESGVGASEATGDGSDARTAGTLRAYTENQLRDVQTANWIEGGKADTIMLGGAQKKVMTGFALNGTLTRNSDSADNKLNVSFKIYGGDYMDFNIIPNRFVDANTVLVLELEKFKIGNKRDFMEKELPSQGDYEAKMLLVESTLISDQEKASGAIHDLSV